jgi:hypothetical protein
MMTSGDLTPLNLCMRVRGGSDDEDATSNGDSTEDEVEDEEETNRKYWEKYADEWDERCEREGDGNASMDYMYHFLGTAEHGFPPWDPKGRLGAVDDIRATITAWKSGDWRPDESDDDDSGDDADDDEEVEVEALYYEPEPEVDNDEWWLNDRKEQLNRAAYYLRQALRHDGYGEGSGLVQQDHRTKVHDNGTIEILDWDEIIKETYAIQGELHQDWDYIDLERLKSMYERLHFDINSLAYNDSNAKADAYDHQFEWTGGPRA